MQVKTEGSVESGAGISHVVKLGENILSAVSATQMKVRDNPSPK